MSFTTRAYSISMKPSPLVITHDAGMMSMRLVGASLHHRPQSRSLPLPWRHGCSSTIMSRKVFLDLVGFYGRICPLESHATKLSLTSFLLLLLHAAFLASSEVELQSKAQLVFPPRKATKHTTCGKRWPQLVTICID
jgi:hypothetical protein